MLCPSRSRQGEKKSPATKDEKLTAEHLPIGAVVETKSGKTGVITHVHKKAGYLFIHNAEAGKTYHVSWASVTKVNGKDAAEIAENGGSTPEPEARAITGNAGASPAPQAAEIAGKETSNEEEVGSLPLNRNGLNPAVPTPATSSRRAPPEEHLMQPGDSSVPEQFTAGPAEQVRRPVPGGRGDARAGRRASARRRSAGPSARRGP